MQTDKYGAINLVYPITMGYYFMKYISDAFALQEKITTEGKLSKTGELEVMMEYLIFIKNKDKLVWESKKNTF